MNLPQITADTAPEPTVLAALAIGAALAFIIATIATK
jgi:hypothetical protein